jgi:hypothetical protein
MNRFSFIAITAAPAIVLFVSLTTCPAHGAVFLDEAASTFTEIRETFHEIKETTEGLWRFLESVSSAVRTIAGWFDPRALVLLFFVLLFSAGFAAIGIPRGRASFFISLSLVDVLWFVWGKSMNEPMVSYAMGMAAANLYLLLPYASYLLLRRLTPALSKRALAAFARRRGGEGRAATKSREELRFLSRRIEDECLGLLASLSGDSAERGAEDTITISEASRERIERLRETLEKLNS